MKMLILTILMVLSCVANADDSEPTEQELLKNVESNSAYKEVVANGFTGKNEKLDLAILEVMATKGMTEQFAEKLNEAQLDLPGPILAYSKKTKALPSKLITAFEKSSNAQFIQRKWSAWAERDQKDEGGKRWFDQATCVTADKEPLIVYPSDFDVELQGEQYAQVIAMESLKRGSASYLYVPRRLIGKQAPKNADDFADHIAKYKASELGGKTMTPTNVQAVLKEDKTKYLRLSVPYSSIYKTEPLPTAKGLQIIAWNDEGHPYQVTMPFKKSLESIKKGGWRGDDKPGCGEDRIQLVVTYKGTQALANKDGLMVQALLFEAVAAYDEWQVLP